MDITRADVDRLPDEWAAEIAEHCDPDGDYARDGYGPYFVIKENLDVPAIREEVEEALSTILEGELSVQ